jgi:hypothetical protein
MILHVTERKNLMIEEAIEWGCQEAMSSLETKGNYIRFDFGETHVGYYCDDADSAQWLCHFFARYFIPTTKLSAQAFVYSTCDPTLWALLQTCSSHIPSTSREEYRDITLNPRSILIHKRSKAASAPEEVYYYLFKPERKLLIVSSGNPQVRRAQALETVRALMKMLLIEKGWLPFHAACCTKNGQGICIVGDKLAGKTSTLINLLAKNGFHIVAIDKCLFYDAGTQLLACGLPGKVGIRPGTLLCHPPLLHWLEKNSDSFFPHMSVEQIYKIAATTSAEEISTRKEKIQLLPSELAALFGVSIEARTALNLFLIPIFEPRLRTSSLAPLGEESHSVALLMESYLSLSRKGEHFLQHFFNINDALLKERLASLLTRFLPDIPIYELYQNGNTNNHSAMLIADVVSRLEKMQISN